ncbi:MAG: hypothetical protein V4812_00785 [Pseudomonadota bacterium]
MLPTFQRHRGRYGVALWLGISLLSLLLTFALVRNSQALGLLELLVAGFAIAVGVTYGASRDAPGYWIYSTLAPKFMLSRDELNGVRGLQFSPAIRWLNPMQTPLGLPLLMAAVVVLLLLSGHTLFPGHPGLVAFTVIGLLFPLLLCVLLLGTARYCLVMASPEGEAALVQGMRGARRVGVYRREDLCITLAINYALIWPLQSKPAFSLAAGYGDAKFVVAALLLGWIAAFFTLLGARRSRLFSAVGEGLSALFQSVPAVPSSPASASGWQRLLTYYAVIALWVLVLCAVLAQLPLLPFPLFCLLLLPVLGGVFWHERGLTLQRDQQQARQFIDELGVAPVAVARRAL